MSTANTRSIVFVQYAGDYAKTYRSLDMGGPETYYAQRHSIEVLGALVDAKTSVTTICCMAEQSEDTLLPNGVRAITFDASNGLSEDLIWQAIKACAATHLCLRTPIPGLLRRALEDDSIKTVLMTLADSFNARGLRARFRNRQLRNLLNHPKVAAVGNHGVNSSESLRRLGVDASKIIPWDWPHSVTPHLSSPKTRESSSTWDLMFVGALAEAKGLGDVMRAVRVLKQAGAPVRLAYAGSGDTERFAKLATRLDINDRVTYLGLVAHSAIVPLMKDADLIIVPSRHEYPEGFPMTIYEALSSRTPIVASDHPMYAFHLINTKSALVYSAGDHRSLASAIEKLMDEPDLYRAMSIASASAWDQLQLPVTWSALIDSWLDQTPGQKLGIAMHALEHIPSTSA